MTHGERDGQADTEAVPDELEGLVDEMRGSFVRRREWQHHDMHKQINQSAIDEAASDRAIEQECEFAAGQVVDGCGTERDDEMQDNSEHGSLYASAVRLHAEDAAGDGLRNANRSVRTVHRDRVRKIQYADDQTTDDDGRKRARVRQEWSSQTDIR